jgi:hypothetical protein
MASGKPRPRDHSPPRPVRRPPRPDDDLVDRAAGVLARHVLAGTALQHAAYASALARDGLLRHFPRESDLSAAVRDLTARGTGALVARAAALPPGRERERVVVEGLVDLTLAWPGVAALGRSRLAAGVPDPDAETQGVRLLTALGIDPAHEHDRVVVAAAALAGLDVAVQLTVAGHPPEAWRHLVVDTVLRAFGHPPSAAVRRIA